MTFQPRFYVETKNGWVEVCKQVYIVSLLNKKEA